MKDSKELSLMANPAVEVINFRNSNYLREENPVFNGFGEEGI